MTFPNHVAGGITFTGIFAAICGVNIFSSVAVFMIGVLASILPDIDIPSSPIGRMFYPLSKWLHRKYGHRTITHSFIALFFSTLIVGSIESWFHDENLYWIVFLFGYLSHLVLDMITIQGVQLFYPFSKSACVLPGKKEYRFQTGNRVHEISVFAASIIVFMFCQPLMTQGFWTTYNRSFGTPKHVFSEFNKSEDLLEIEYFYRVGSEEFKGKGYCIESTDKGMTLVENGKFKKLDNSKMVILSTVPTHTGKKFEFEYLSFVAISLDSLNTLVSRDYILELEVQANQKFVTRVGEVESTVSKVKEKYLNQFIAFEPLFAETINEDFVTYANPRINSLRSQLASYEKEFKEAKRTLKEKKQREEYLEKEALKATDLYKKETLMADLAELRKNLKLGFDETKIPETKRQIQELVKSDAIKYSEKKAKFEKDRESNLVEETRFTGALRYLKID